MVVVSEGSLTLARWSADPAVRHGVYVQEAAEYTARLRDRLARKIVDLLNTREPIERFFPEDAACILECRQDEVEARILCADIPQLLQLASVLNLSFLQVVLSLS